MRTWNLDRWGIAASALCAVHCAFGAALVGIAGLGSLLGDERIELALAFAAMVIAIVALIAGYRRHARSTPLWLAAAGVLSILLARIELAPVEDLEVALSVTGALLLIGGHLSNLRLLRSADGCCAPSQRARR